LPIGVRAASTITGSAMGKGYCETRTRSI